MNATTHDDLELEPPQEQKPPQRGALLRRVRTGMRFVDLGFFILYGVITLQIVLEALGARDSNGFKHFLDTVSGPFLDPFRGLLQDPAVENHQVMLSFIAALIIYGLIQGMIKRAVAVALAAYLQMASNEPKIAAKPRNS